MKGTRSAYVVARAHKPIAYQAPHRRCAAGRVLHRVQWSAVDLPLEHAFVAVEAREGEEAKPRARSAGNVPRPGGVKEPCSRGHVTASSEGRFASRTRYKMDWLVSARRGGSSLAHGAAIRL